MNSSESKSAFGLIVTCLGQVCNRRSNLSCRTHQSLIACTENLSPFYRVSADPETFARNPRHAIRLVAEQRIINCYGHFRVLRLHRIYLAQSYRSA